MNIHPLIVHFPIALLTTYSIFELIRFRFVLRQNYWFYIKATLVILGAIAAWVAYFAGQSAKKLISDTNIRMVVSKHELFAQLSIAIFSILASGYIVAWINTYNVSWIKSIPVIGHLWRFGIWMQVLITETKLTLLLALLGLICLFITGALGGSIVYGQGNDPVTNYIYNLFFQ